MIIWDSLRLGFFGIQWDSLDSLGFLDSVKV